MAAPSPSTMAEELIPEGHPSAPHKWELDDRGRVNLFALDEDFTEGWGGHNGPRCTVCGLTFCEHCHDYWATPCPSDYWELS